MSVKGCVEYDHLPHRRPVCVAHRIHLYQLADRTRDAAVERGGVAGKVAEDGKELSMTVKELIRELKQKPESSIVVCQSDPEGNGFSLCFKVEAGSYDTKSGTAYGYQSDDGTPCVFIVPS
jgi:hypothetical protein